MAQRDQARAQASAEENRLLAAAQERDRSLLMQHLETVDLPYAEVLFEPEQEIDYLYFVRSGVVSAVKKL
jgi:CRP-like cAMP-binding protein